MSAYIYQSISLTTGQSYQLTFDYSSDADVSDGSFIYAGFSENADIVAQTDVNSLPNSSQDNFAVGPSETGTRTFTLVAGAGQDTLFLTMSLSGAGNVTFDNVSVQGIDPDAQAQGFIEKTLENSLNLSTFADAGVVFLAVEIPQTGFTSIGVRLGQDSTNYYDLTATEGFLGAFAADNFFLVALPLSEAQTVGSPDISDIQYVRVYLNYTGGPYINVRLGALWVALPYATEIIYQTAALFKDTAGVLRNNITSDNNTIILNDAAYSILELEAAKTIALQQAGGQYTDQIKGFDAILNDTGSEQGLYTRYRANTPSTQLRTVDSYYDI